MSERYELWSYIGGRTGLINGYKSFDMAMHIARFRNQFYGHEWAIFRQSDKVVIAWSKAWEPDEKFMAWRKWYLKISER